jgi:WD40 repeat protein
MQNQDDVESSPSSAKVHSQSYFQNISSFIPDYVKNFSFASNNAKSNANSATDQDKDVTLYSNFQFVDLSPPTAPLFARERRLFLSIGYSNGFQVFDVSDPSHIKEIVSIRDEKPVKIVKVLPLPEPDENVLDEKIILKDKYPVVAVVTCEDKPGSNNSVVKFYSLKTQEYVHMLKFNSEVYQIACNSQAFIVAAKNQVFAFDIRTLEKLTYFNCFPNSSEFMGENMTDTSVTNVVALGPRWLAFPSNQTVTNPALDFAQLSNQSLAEISMDVAKKAASGIYYLGDLGVKKMINYLNPENTPTQAQPTQRIIKSVPHAGTIEIRDIQSKQIIAHFRAHKDPISAIAFDPSGTLLATASVEGTVVNVFKIMPNASGKVSSNGKGIRHLYKLYRGITSANIQSIEFSINSKWVAVSSSHGTTHIFAINPDGGEVMPSTHIPPPAATTPTLPPAYPENKEPYTLSVVSRIYNNSSSFGGPNEPIKTTFHSPVATTFYSALRAKTKRTSTAERMLVATGRGQLMYYRMEPFESQFEPNVIDLRIQTVGNWETGRTKHQQPNTQKISFDKYLEPFTIPKRNDDEMKSLWISNVEIETYEPPKTQLWMTGQFKFKTFEKPTSQNSPHIYPELPSLSDSSDDLRAANNMLKSIFIPVTDPIPLYHKLSSSTTSVGTPSAPPAPVSEISKAIETPLLLDQQTGKQDWQILDEEDVLPKVQSIDMSQKKSAIKQKPIDLKTLTVKTKELKVVEEDSEDEHDPYFKDTNPTIQSTTPVQQPQPQPQQNTVTFKEPEETKPHKLVSSIFSRNDNYFESRANLTKSNLLGSEIVSPRGKEDEDEDETTVNKANVSVDYDFFGSEKTDRFLNKYPQYANKPLTVTPVFRSSENLAASDSVPQPVEQPKQPSPSLLASSISNDHFGKIQDIESADEED